MNEQFFLEQFNSLEDIEIVDNQTSRRIAWAEGLSQTYSALYAEAWGDEEEIDKLNSMLYEELEGEAIKDPNYGQVVYVTGLVERQFYNDETDDFTTAAIECTGVAMIAAGYTARINESEGRLHILQQFDTGDKIRHVKTGELRDSVTRLFAGAPVGSVQVDTYDFGVKQISEVEYAHPQVVAMLDDALTTSGGYVNVFQKMARCIVPDRLDVSPGHIYILQSYVENILDLDTSVPYRADVTGMCTLDIDGGPETVLNLATPDGMLLRPNRMLLREMPTPDPQEGAKMSRYKKWGLHATMLAPRDGQDVDIIIPIEAITSFVSVRDASGVSH